MGFFGDFILARSEQPLLDLPLLVDATCREGEAGCLSMCWPRPGGWQTIQIHHGWDTDEQDDLLQGVVYATGAPAMLATVMDSDLCTVRGLSLTGAEWSVDLDPVMATEYGIPAQAPHDDGALPDESDADRNLKWFLAAIPQSVEQIADWSAEAGCEPDRDALAAVLAKRADPFVEGLFFELIDACGLPGSVPEEDPRDTPAHFGHRPNSRCPRGRKLELAVLNLPRDRHLVLECETAPNCYAQVWHRPDGTYQLEYRDRSPAQHYQTRTLSADKVVTALAGWVAGDIAWREDFDWTNIGDWFTEVSADHADCTPESNG